MYLHSVSTTPFPRPPAKRKRPRIFRFFSACLIHDNILGTHNNTWNMVGIQYIILESMNYSEQSISSGLRNSNLPKYLRQVLLMLSMLISPLENSKLVLGLKKNVIQGLK